jgi:virginiamycin B lyase
MAISGSPHGITTGPDGMLWFTENGANQIARVDFKCVISEFPIPTSNSGPHVITMGPDRRLWFTELNATQLARVSRGSGHTVNIMEYPLPVPASSGPGSGIPGGSTTGGGALAGGGTSAFGNLFGIAAQTDDWRRDRGTDDDYVWFTELMANQIGRIRVEDRSEVDHRE